MKKAGYLSVFTGPMFSGKTSMVESKITCYADIFEGRRVLMVNSILDKRDEENLISCHSSSYTGLSRKIDVVTVLHLADVNAEKYSVIGVDECQFFDDLVPRVEQWLTEGKHIYCAGLDSDANLKRFGHIHELLYLADDFVKLNACCSLCLNEGNDMLALNNMTKAPFTGRRVGIQPGKEQIDVGAEEKYLPLCRQHMIFTV